MKSPLMVAVFTLVLATTPAVTAYDPMPDPRMSPNAPGGGSAQTGSGQGNADSDGYRTRSDETRRRNGEPKFGANARRKGGYDYGSGAR